MGVLLFRSLSELGKEKEAVKGRKKKFWAAQNLQGGGSVLLGRGIRVVITCWLRFCTKIIRDNMCHDRLWEM